MSTGAGNPSPLHLDWTQFSQLADVLSFASSLMTIIGIGGLITWSQLGDRLLTRNERARAIAVFGIRTLLALVAFVPIFVT